MATLEIGSSSSDCLDCRKAGRPFDAAASETGHYTVLGYRHNGEPGCGQPWTRAYSVYSNGSDRSMRERLVAIYPHLEPVLTDYPTEDDFHDL